MWEGGQCELEGVVRDNLGLIKVLFIQRECGVVVMRTWDQNLGFQFLFFIFGFRIWQYFDYFEFFMICKGISYFCQYYLRRKVLKNCYY